MEPQTVAVVGATGALGTELMRTLERAATGIGALVPLASRARRGAEVEFNGRSLPVKELSAEALEGVDLALVAVPPNVDRAPLDRLLDSGGRVVDLGGLWGPGEAPCAVYGVTRGVVDAALETGVVRGPGPVALALIAALGPIHAAVGLVAARGTALLPSTVAGRQGIEELSQQVIALFNQREPPRSTFPDGLAFDILPQWGPAVPQWTLGEGRASEEAGEVLGLPPEAIAVSEVVVPVFAGMGLSLHVLTDGPLRAEGLRQLLEGGRSVRLFADDPRELMARRQLGRAWVAVGRLRDDPAGQGVHLWVAADPLRLTAANAVGLGLALLGGAR